MPGRSQPRRAATPVTSTRFGRRDAFRLGGIGLSVAAIAAACGDDRGGDTAPGRVGYAPTPEPLPPFPVDDSVYLRTSTSVEVTIVDVYSELLAGGELGADVAAAVTELVTRHQVLVEQLSELTSAAGGTPWPCANPWMVDRLIAPIRATIAESDDPARDLRNLAISLENVAAATHQSFTRLLSVPELRPGTAGAAAVDSRNAATLVILTGGPEAYVSPAIDGGEVPRVDGIPEQFAITSRFGSLAQFELVVGAPDENGTRTTYLLNTPAENSYIYNELDPSC
ncbi:MAG: hypothetical protein QNM02_14075 [Acidimicrobiia bacterium]|nr:hypothetical protein [Acidimicrobiia bacterium]